MSNAISEPSRRLSVTRRRASLPQAYVIVGGFTLGIMSFAGDVLPGLLGEVVLAVFSTGSAWCSLSVLAGYQFTRRPHSSLAAVALLLLATLTYYAVTALSGVRFGGQQVDQTSSGPVLSSVDWLSELASMARGAGFWVAASLAVGVVMGQLGNLIRNGKQVWCTVAIGMTFGIIAGPGISGLVMILRFGVNRATSQLILPMICGALLAIFVLVWAVVLKRTVIRWPLLVAVSALSCAIVTLALEVVQVVRNQL